MIRNYMYYKCSHSMAGHFTTQKVLKLVLGEDEDDEQYNDIYFDGSDEDFGLVEEEVRDELILDKNEHGINDRAVMDVKMSAMLIITMTETGRMMMCTVMITMMI